MLTRPQCVTLCTVDAPACRLEERRSKLQGQLQAMQQVQQRERQMMHEFSALAEEHMSAATAPLKDAQQALDQVNPPALRQAGVAPGALVMTLKLECNANLKTLVCGDTNQKRHAPAIHIHLCTRCCRLARGCKIRSTWRRHSVPCRWNAGRQMQMLRHWLNRGRRLYRNSGKCR